ncbi:hypothetical protein [Streptomyces dysideae]|nr:hypothetical protein [Streptomyces dysideae]
MAHAIRTGAGFAPDITTAIRTHRLLAAIRSAARSGSRQHLA